MFLNTVLLHIAAMASEFDTAILHVGSLASDFESEIDDEVFTAEQYMKSISSKSKVNIEVRNGMSNIDCY